MDGITQEVRELTVLSDSDVPRWCLAEQTPPREPATAL